MIEFELDIPSLTQHGIQMGEYIFCHVNELNSWSMINELIMIKMPILLIDSFDRRANYQELKYHKSPILQAFQNLFSFQYYPH